MRNDPDHLHEFANSGSEPAFNRLVADHLPLVHGTAIRRVHGDSHLAQDITQMVFVDLATKASGLPDDVPLAGWLYRHTCFKAAEVLRAAQRRRQREFVAANDRALQSTEADPDWSRLAPVLDEALADLAPADRDVLVLRFFAQRSLRDVGLALGLGEDAAQKRVARALERLRRLLERRGIASTAAALAATIGAHATPPVPASLAAAITAAVLPHLGTVTSPGIAAAAWKWWKNGSTLRHALIAALVATAPLLVQQVQIATAQSRLFELEGNRARLADQTASSGRRLHALDQQWATLQQRQSRLAASLATATAVATERGAAGDAGLYQWDPESDWVRLPKSILTNLPIRRGSTAGAGSPRYTTDPIDPSGTPSAAILDVLGLEPEAQQDLARFCQDFFQGYERDASRRSRFLTSIPSDVPTAWIQPQPHLHLRLTPALAAPDSTALRESFHTGLLQRLGPERTSAFWYQVSEVFPVHCDDFGTVTRLLGLRPSSPGAADPENIPASRLDQAWTLIRLHQRTDGWQFDGEVWAGEFNRPALVAEIASGPEIPFQAIPSSTQP